MLDERHNWPCGLWQYLHAEEKLDTKRFSEPDGRREESIHEIGQKI